MKKIFFITICLIPLFNCTENYDVDFTVSSTDIAFPVNGGEKQVNINTVVDGWDVTVSADWLLVRRSQNILSITADNNNSGESRSYDMNLSYRGQVKEILSIIQEGVRLNLESDRLNFGSDVEIKTIDINANTTWEASSYPDWCVIKKENMRLQIQANKNYSMKEREGRIVLASGSVTDSITVLQDGCNWDESFNMIFVDGGTYLAGAQKTDLSGDNYDPQAYQVESPVHKVTVSGFYISQYEVSQAQWSVAMGNNPSAVQDENLPVTDVSWNDVQNFLLVLNERTGKDYRLPTEAEWEFAAKGGTASRLFKYSGSSVLGACGWFYSNSNSVVHAIGTKGPNELDIYDMSGNIREWCSDWFGYYSVSPIEDPQGPDNGSMKVNRGGSWSTPAVNCRNSYRHTDYSDGRASDLGFRIAINDIEN